MDLKIIFDERNYKIIQLEKWVKKMNKFFLAFLMLVSFTFAQAQDEKTATLVVSGQGKTADEAKTNALRSAIEQAFGAFISSNTTILHR